MPRFFHSQIMPCALGIIEAWLVSLISKPITAISYNNHPSVAVCVGWTVSDHRSHASFLQPLFPFTEQSRSTSGLRKAYFCNIKQAVACLGMI